MIVASASPPRICGSSFVVAAARAASLSGNWLAAQDTSAAPLLTARVPVGRSSDAFYVGVATELFSCVAVLVVLCTVFFKRPPHYSGRRLLKTKKAPHDGR
eukprot:GHVU01209900.1.p3 GENE.GHVU01209900.1~~GHVU01209900.1.p3  ORF type:complete len:101 (+),score=9.88 GHVU01209900.1:88-390(+)